MKKIILVLFTACRLKHHAFALLLLTVLFSFQCSKPKDAAKTEIDQLPPATQNGANTFGCLVNGKAWTPKGWDGHQANFLLIADPGYRNGDFSLRTYRINENIKESIVINSDSIRNSGVYPINDTMNTRVIFSRGTGDLSQIFCTVYYNGTYNRKGLLKVTNYDYQKGIISGEFEFSMVNKACSLGDTIKVTNGRFDYKL